METYDMGHLYDGVDIDELGGGHLYDRTELTGHGAVSYTHLTLPTIRLV